MSRMLDSPIALLIVIAGILLAVGRRTAASWFRCDGVRDDWDRFYDLLASVGENAGSVVHPLLSIIAKRFCPGTEGYLTLAIDESLAKSLGRHVEGGQHSPQSDSRTGRW